MRAKDELKLYSTGFWVVLIVLILVSVSLHYETKTSCQSIPSLGMEDYIFSLELKEIDKKLDRCTDLPKKVYCQCIGAEVNESFSIKRDRSYLDLLPEDFPREKLFG